MAIVPVTCWPASLLVQYSLHVALVKVKTNLSTNLSTVLQNNEGTKVAAGSHPVSGLPGSRAWGG